MAQFNQSPTIHYQDGMSQFSEMQGRRDMLATMQLPAQYATVQTHLEGAREIAVTHHLEPHYHEYTQVTTPRATPTSLSPFPRSRKHPVLLSVCPNITRTESQDSKPLNARWNFSRQRN